jgi:hypothetical protein
VCFPGAHTISWSQLSAIGPFHQDHSDGHDKLNAQALQMGNVSLPIYGMKDQWSSFVKHLVTVPDNPLQQQLDMFTLTVYRSTLVMTMLCSLVFSGLTFTFTVIPITSVIDKGQAQVLLWKPNCFMVHNLILYSLKSEL